MVRLHLLGPVELEGATGPALLGGTKERVLLAMLALHPRQSVAEDRLVEALWGEDPPRTATKTLRSYVSRLRRGLAEVGAADHLSIETTPGGYRLRAADAVVDVARVEDLLAQARQAAARGDHTWAAVTLGEALRSWRGRPLGEFADEPWAAADASRLAELRLTVLEERIDAELACGRDTALVAELEAICTAHPLRERLWAQRMLALYRSGRQAEALRVYQELRETLAAELGIDPSSELQALERRVLTQDPALAWKPPVESGATPRSPLAPRAIDLPTGVVTFLLTDIEGSSHLWDLDPEAMAAALLRHDQLVADAVATAGGRIIKSKGEGDATLSVFGRASEAVAAALGLQMALAKEEWPPDVPLRVRMALHTGEAYEREGDYYGPTVNRAARLRALAGGTQVVMSEATAALVRDHLPPGAALVDLGRHELRGLSRDEQVYELRVAELDPANTREPTSEPAPPLSFPAGLHVGRPGGFVGRSRELDQLREQWQQALRGPWQGVLVGGEPGIGKSRLVGEFAATLFRDGATVLFGTCEEDLGVPYQPFAEALRAYVGCCPLDVLRDHVRRSGGDLARLVPELAQRVPDAPPPLESEPESERYRLFEAVVALLAAAAEVEPVLLVLDDLQWATKPTLLLLRHLVRAAEPRPMLILGMYRHTELSAGLAETLADLRRSPGVERMTLGGLDEEAVVDLLEALSGSTLDDAGRRFARRLSKETGGSPFFVREVVSHLRETGTIHEENGVWTSDLPGDQVDLPASVREVIVRRLGRLSEPARRVLMVASVVGPSFPVSVLQAVEGGQDRDLVFDALDEAVASGMIRETAGGTAAYAFTHALVRQALYEDVSVLRRARLHRRVAEAIEALPGSDDERVSELATHYLAAAADGVADKAIEYATLAARRAAARVAHEEAVRFREQALEVLQWVRGGDSAEECDLLLALAESQWRAGDTVPSRETYARAAELARRLRDGDRLAAAALRNNADLGGHARAIRADPVLIALLEEALEALAPGDSVLRARLLGRLAVEHFYTPDLERRAALSNEGVAMAERLGDKHVLLFTLNCREWATMGLDLDARLAAAGDVLRRAHELGDLEVAYQARYLRHLVFAEAGDFAAADAEADEGQRLADELRLPGILPWVDSYRSLRAWLAGDIADAERRNQQGLNEALARPVDPELVFAHFGGQAMVYLYLRPGMADIVPALEEMARAEGVPPAFEFALCLLYGLAGRDDDAGRLLDDIFARGLSAIPRDAQWLSNVPMLGLACRRVRDRPRAAAELYDELVLYADRWASSPAVTWGPISRVAGILASVLGRFDDAEQHFHAALEVTSALPAPLFHAETCYDLAVMLIDRSGPGDHDRARQLLDTALASADRLGLATLTEWAISARARL